DSIRGLEARATPSGAQGPPRTPGQPTSATSMRSPFEHPARTPIGQVTGASLSPLQDLSGTITPTDLHFERHHGGVPTIDPTEYRLLIHGLVRRPTVLELEDLKRLPSITRGYFLGCSGNGRTAYRSPQRQLPAPRVHGLTATPRRTGVPRAA